MREAEQILPLVGGIYDTTLDPSSWPRALEKTAAFVGGRGAALLARDSTRKTGNVAYRVGTDPRYSQTYFEEYIELDPLSAAYLALDVGKAFIYSDFVPPPEFVETRFYQEWVRPQGWVEKMFVTLERSGTTLASLAIFFHQSDHLADGAARDGLADEAARRRLQLIAPHVGRAMLVGAAMERKATEAAALADTLDSVSTAMFLVDARGRIVHNNASGQALLDERCVMRAGSGKLAAIAADADRELNQTFALAGAGDAAVGVKGIAVPLAARDGERYVAHVLPLTSGERRRAGASYDAVAALFVRKAELGIPSPPEAIARLYKLTPTELRVLLAVVEVGGVPEVAEELGIGEATVKTHLHRLFAKTETTRQADLVKLVAAFSSPLLN
jgi:DNA-binding CsgD family transcriptional regulator